MYGSATVINPAIVRAYRQTHYGVRAASRFSLRIGRHSAPLQVLHSTQPHSLALLRTLTSV